MPIKKESFLKQRSDQYMDGMEAIVFFLYSNKDRAFTSAEISYETDINDKELVLRILTDLKKERKIVERLIFDGKKSDFYYLINEDEIEKEQTKDEDAEQETSGEAAGAGGS